jgi:hypothetical protein
MSADLRPVTFTCEGCATLAGMQCVRCGRCEDCCAEGGECRKEIDFEELPRL